MINVFLKMLMDTELNVTIMKLLRVINQNNEFTFLTFFVIFL